MKFIQPASNWYTKIKPTKESDDEKKTKDCERHWIAFTVYSALSSFQIPTFEVLALCFSISGFDHGDTHYFLSLVFTR